jgi:hypothetical protein
VNCISLSPIGFTVTGSPTRIHAGVKPPINILQIDLGAFGADSRCGHGKHIGMSVHLQRDFGASSASR